MKQSNSFFALIFFLFACQSNSETKILVTDLELDTSSAVMLVDETLPLTAIITPPNASNQTLYWNSDNSSVAEVSAYGLVTAKSFGNATITVSTESGNKSSSCEIRVSPIAVASVSLSLSKISMYVGETCTLNPVITPVEAANKDVDWESSNPSVATVVDGFVAAASQGTAVITVTTVDGAKTASCEVTVMTVAVANVSLSSTIINMAIAESQTLTAVITPENTTNKVVSWESANPLVATVADGQVTAVNEGTTLISVITQDGKKTATCTVRVYFVHDPTLKIVDRFATKETKALYRNLLAIQNVGTMFGHHNSLMYGRQWYDISGRSDVKEICGDFPAVFSTDFCEIMDGRTISLYGGSSAAAIAIRRRCILEAYARGEVITACIHINNPLTGGTAWDNSNRTVVREILREGSTINVRYKTWLNRLADFANNLKDPSGTLIPILFRPYHEHTQTWSWWSQSCTTEQEFVNLWRWTIRYLRDEKGVRNFLYAISPQMDGNYGTPGTRERLLFRWPGNEWVDFLGMDCYHWTNTAAYRQNISVMVDIGKEKGIPVGVTETGITGIGWGENGQGTPVANYWTVQMLEPLKTTMQSKTSTVSMVVMWRNKYVGSNINNDTHFFGPWIGHPSAPDFIQLYEDPITIFSADIPFNMYE